jgi:uncharacterized protein YjdB
MRSYTRLALAFIAACALGACGEAATPVIAGLGDGSTTSGSSTSTLAISPNAVQLTVGAVQQLNTNAPASLQNQVQWNSLQTTIATISPSGLVTALAAGTATITARYSSDTTNVATATVVVTALTTP